MLSLLMECTVLMLRAIYELYSIQRITYNEFLNFTENKLSFLAENLNSIPSESEKSNALEILDKCVSLLSQNGKCSLPPMFRDHFDIVQ